MNKIVPKAGMFDDTDGHTNVLYRTQFLDQLCNLELYLSRIPLYKTNFMIQTKMCEINRIECFSTVARCTQSAFLTKLHIFCIKPLRNVLPFQLTL